MHVMPEHMNIIMYGNGKSSCCNPVTDANTTELRRIRRTMENGINELKTLSESRDRVDISLKEYEDLKRVNKDLQIRLNQAERILGMLDIPADMIQHIDPDSVKIYSAEAFDPTNIFVRKRRCRIEFNVEEYD